MSIGKYSVVKLKELQLGDVATDYSLIQLFVNRGVLHCPPLHHPYVSTPHLAPGISISPPLIPLSLEARGGGGHHPCPAVISRSPLVQPVVKSGAFKTVKASCLDDGFTYIFGRFCAEYPLHPPHLGSLHIIPPRPPINSWEASSHALLLAPPRLLDLAPPLIIYKTAWGVKVRWTPKFRQVVKSGFCSVK